MKNYAVVKQKHLYNGQKNVMYQGVVEVGRNGYCTSLDYQEYDGCTSVHVEAHAQQLTIHRKGDVESILEYALHQKTKGKLMTEFGMIELELYTHKYIRKENIIAIEYDIMQNDEVIEGYRIIWNLKEEVA